MPGTENIWGGTLGGRIIKDRTFFFAGFQEDRQNSSGSATAAAPTAAGWATLNALFPKGSNPRVDIYRAVLGTTTATAQPAMIALGNNRPGVEMGVASISYPSTFRDRLISFKGDHRISDRDSLSARYSGETKPIFPATLSYPGMQTGQDNWFKNAVFSETHVFSPSMTNEFRAGYNRIGLSSSINTDNPLGKTLPNYAIAGVPTATITALGVATNLPQGRLANNYTLQDTYSVVQGRHTFRAGFDLLLQRSRQFASINERGSFTYNSSNIAVNGVTQNFTCSATSTSLPTAGVQHRL